MDKETLKRVMRDNNLNVKKVAALLLVAERTVYNWLEGVRKIPPMAAELLRVKVGGVEQ